ncbi:MAG: hypothetical protein LAP21_06185 [Acidobacteriia bacterium]|nr:hypothetical protein [Terriglobia bacterium]
MSTAKMLVEAGFGNAIAPVTSTFTPAMMFTLPMLGAMALPYVPVIAVLLVFVSFYRVSLYRVSLYFVPFYVFRLPAMRLLPFRPAVLCPLIVNAFFVAWLLHIHMVLIRMLRHRLTTPMVLIRVLLPRRTIVFSLMFVSVILAGITFLVVAALCAGKRRGSQKQA